MRGALQNPAPLDFDIKVLPGILFELRRFSYQVVFMTVLAHSHLVARLLLSIKANYRPDRSTKAPLLPHSRQMLPSTQNGPSAAWRCRLSYFRDCITTGCITMTFDYERRTEKDRRTKSGFSLRSLFLGGSRKKIRRQGDKKRIFYLDHYSPGLFFIIVSILFLCAIDALLTLFLLARGAYEINPLMAYALKFGPYAFFSFKYLLTILPVIFLLIFRNVVIRMLKISTRTVLYFMAIFYLVVVAYELYMVHTLAWGPELKPPPQILSPTMVCRV